MFRKLLIATTILGLSSGLALASNSPYVGVSVGALDNTSTNANFRGMPVTVFAGFGGEINNGITLAGEVYGVPVTGIITDHGLRNTYGYGVSLLPGVMISDHTMGYLRVGLVRTHFTPSGGRTSTISGGQVGVGLQTTLMQNWDLRGEYTYTGYNNITNVAGAPKQDQFDLGLVYKFE